MSVMPFGPGWGQAKRTAVSGPASVSDLLYQSFYDTLPGWYTFTRASSAWGFNSAGVLTQFANDVSRQVYDPVTLTPQGTLVEPSSSNQIANPRMEGAVAPSTWPTGSSGFATNGLTRTVVGIGYEDGIPYLDMRVNGTATAAAQAAYQPTTTTAIAALTGQTWTHSVFLRVVGGALGTPDFVRVQTVENTSAGVFVTGGNITVIPTAAALRTQRYSYTRTLSGGATVAAVQPSVVIQYPTGTVVDVTLRISLPQMEQLPYVSSPIMPPVGSPAVSTRAADNLLLPLPFAGFPGAVGWTAMLEFVSLALAGNMTSLGAGAGGVADNADTAGLSSAGVMFSTKRIGGVTANTAGLPAVALGAVAKYIMAVDTVGLSAAINGSAVASATLAGYVPPDTLSIGRAPWSAFSYQPMYVRRLRLWPRKLSDAELQGMTT